MSTSRSQKLAEIIVNHSCEVKKGDTVEIAGQQTTMPLFREIAKLCYQKGAFVRANIYDEELAYIRFKYASTEVLKTRSKFMAFEAKNIDVFITLDGDLNTNVLANIDPKRIQLPQKANIKARQEIIEKKRWLICCYPSSGLAQDARMSLAEYEDFVFDACIQDWNKITKDCQKVGDLLQKTKQVRIMGEETDLKIGIKGCIINTTERKKQGLRNMPDGEVFTSPNRAETEGHIYFPWPSKKGKEVKDVRLEFKKGKVVKATASMNEDYLLEVLKTDKLSSSLGEFAIGMNYGIKKYTNNILFDEKIGGTTHIALGAGYKETGGDSNSAIHWDLVKDLREFGEIWFDGKLVIKNGQVVV